MPSQSTRFSRVLARWRPRRPGWATVRVTPTHRIDYDPTVYAGPVFPGPEHYRDDPQWDFIDDDRVGPVALFRRDP